jgi:effector-binding domain-containing protein
MGKSDEKYDKLVNWVSQNGKIPSPMSKDFTEKILGNWVRNKRVMKRKGQLQEDEIKKMEKISGWFWDPSEMVDPRYDECVNWVNKNGRIPSSASDDLIERSLAIWAGHKRGYKREGKLSIDEIKQIEKINGWDWDPTDTFDEKSKELIDWVNINGRLPSSSAKDPKEKQLGNWATHRRKDKRQGRLADDRINKLEQIDGWHWHKDELQDEIYDEFADWVNKNKKMPSVLSKDKTERKLGTWACNRRVYQKIGKLPEEDAKKLEKLNGWYWSTETHEIKSFDEIYDELVIWVNKNDKLPTVAADDKREKKLAIWVGNRRADNKEGKLPEDKIKKLEKINGWFWTIEGHEIKSFDEMYNELVEWTKKNGKLPTSMSKDAMERKIGEWANTKRQCKKEGKLSEDIIKKLEQVNGWFWNANDLFNIACSELNDWINKNDRLPLNKSENEMEKKLANWINYRRIEKKKGKLSDERIKKLEEINKWSWEKEKRVKTKKEKLVKGKKKKATIKSKKKKGKTITVKGKKKKSNINDYFAQA